MFSLCRRSLPAARPNMHSCSSPSFLFRIVVRTALDEDKKPLQANSVQISVSCIECRLGRVGVVHSNVLADYTQTLWAKPSSVEYADLGDGDFPFKIVVPIKTLGNSYLNFQDYRVFWRVEAGPLPPLSGLRRSANFPQSLTMLPSSVSAPASTNLMIFLSSATIPMFPTGITCHHRLECSLPPSLVPLLSNINSCNRPVLSVLST